MRTLGMRGKSSPMTNPRTTQAQKDTIHRVRAEAEAEGVGIFEVRYSTYIGPGCAAERGDITTCADGKIYRMVMPDGQVY